MKDEQNLGYNNHCYESEKIKFAKVVVDVHDEVIDVVW